MSASWPNPANRSVGSSPGYGNSEKPTVRTTSKPRLVNSSGRRSRLKRYSATAVSAITATACSLGEAPTLSKSLMAQCPRPLQETTGLALAGLPRKGVLENQLDDFVEDFHEVDFYPPPDVIGHLFVVPPVGGGQ